jgi:hypothetical protein
MTSGKAVRLQKVAAEVACVKCHVNPRFGSLQRCKACLKADAEAERVARERLLRPQPAIRSNRQQAGSTRARKPAATPTGKSLVPARQVQPMPGQSRNEGEPFSIQTWAAMGARWLAKFLRSKPADQRATAERAMAAEQVTQNIGFARITYGSVPIAALYPRTNQDLAVVQWGLERQGVKIDMVEANGSVEDVKTLCTFCNARVKMPCTPSRANSCRNRSRY